MLTGDSARYCAAVVGEYLYGVCNHRYAGEGAKMHGTLVAFRAKRTLEWLANVLSFANVNETVLVSMQDCANVSGVLPNYP